MYPAQGLEHVLRFSLSCREEKQCPNDLGYSETVSRDPKTV